MLRLLVQNRGRMLTKDELLKTLWPNSVVEESNLTQQISMIRKALGETAGEDRYIVTVPARGYRFAAEVKGWLDAPAAPGEPLRPSSDYEEAPLTSVVPAPSTEKEAAPPKPDTESVYDTPAPTTTRWVRSWFALGMAVLVVGLGALLYTAYQAHGTGRTGTPRTLAILPFQSLRADAQNDFLGFSLADAVITKLDYVNSLTVRPSSAIERYRNQPVDIPRIAGELHVDTLLTGNFIREGDDLRITSQVIDVKTQDILWKGTFDLKYERLLTVQDRVAQEIIKGLKLSLSPSEQERLNRENAVSPAAYEYFLRGVDLYARNDFPMAIKMLQRSAEIDSKYALTWAHLGRAHTANASFELGGRDEYNAAEAAYQRALALNPKLIEAQIYMANRFTDTGKVESAVPMLREAERTSPNDAEVHWELGYAYRFGGMLPQSVSECERARELDPGVKLSTSTLTTYLYLGKYDKFLDSLPKNSDSALILFYRGFAEYHKRNRTRAAREFERAFAMHPSLLQARVGKALSYGIAGEHSKGLEILGETESKIAEKGVGDPEAIYKIAQGYAELGDKVSSLRVLRHSIEGGFFSYPYFISDPLLASVRSEGEFAKLMDLARPRHEAFKAKFF
jgi:TolB-like protein/DNA-binding winged helix-turn-helix (wHTH) protein